MKREPGEPIWDDTVAWHERQCDVAWRELEAIGDPEELASDMVDALAKVFGHKEPEPKPVDPETEFFFGANP